MRELCPLLRFYTSLFFRRHTIAPLPFSSSTAVTAKDRDGQQQLAGIGHDEPPTVRAITGRADFLAFHQIATGKGCGLSPICIKSSFIQTARTTDIRRLNGRPSKPSHIARQSA